MPGTAEFENLLTACAKMAASQGEEVAVTALGVARATLGETVAKLTTTTQPKTTTSSSTTTSTTTTSSSTASSSADIKVASSSSSSSTVVSSSSSTTQRSALWEELSICSGSAEFVARYFLGGDDGWTLAGAHATGSASKNKAIRYALIDKNTPLNAYGAMARDVSTVTMVSAKPKGSTGQSHTFAIVREGLRWDLYQSWASRFQIFDLQRQQCGLYEENILEIIRALVGVGKRATQINQTLFGMDSVCDQWVFHSTSWNYFVAHGSYDQIKKMFGVT